MSDRIFIIIIVILSGSGFCPAADNGFERALLPLLENHCFDCHDADTQQGDLALHTLHPDVMNGGDEAVWAVVLDQLNSWGEAATGETIAYNAQLADRAG